MAECEFLSGCPFFNNRMRRMPSTAELIKSRYCRGNFETCARYRVRQAIGPEAVTDDLFPDNWDMATELINAAQHAVG